MRGEHGSPEALGGIHQLRHHRREGDQRQAAQSVGVGNPADHLELVGGEVGFDLLLGCPGWEIDEGRGGVSLAHLDLGKVEDVQAERREVGRRRKAVRLCGQGSGLGVGEGGEVKHHPVAGKIAIHAQHPRSASRRRNGRSGRGGGSGRYGDRSDRLGDRADGEARGQRPSDDEPAQPGGTGRPPACCADQPARKRRGQQSIARDTKVCPPSLQAPAIPACRRLESVIVVSRRGGVNGQICRVSQRRRRRGT